MRCRPAVTLITRETLINHQNHRDKVETGGTENAGPERNEKGPVLKMHLSSRRNDAIESLRDVSSLRTKIRKRS